ncbi:MAG: hypothetical protein HFJ29_06410 [Clostridia bacterium]|nr:hypothetical protein [Clostridia bacterium]
MENLFCKYVKGIKPTILYPEKEKLEQLLTITENESNTFQLVAPSEYEKFLIEAIRYDTPAHISIEELKRIFSQNERSKITCMHFDDEITMQMAECLGFNVARVKGLRELER